MPDFFYLSPNVELTTCTDCGAAVSVPNQAKHRQWHAELLESLTAKLKRQLGQAAVTSPVRLRV